MTLKQKKKAVSKIAIGSYIIDEYGAYKVTKIYKSGIQYIREWKNWAGNFHEYHFVSYEELLGESHWMEIIT